MEFFSSTFDALKRIAQDGGSLTETLLSASNTVRGEAEAWGLIDSEREPVRYVQLPNPDEAGTFQTQQVTGNGGLVAWVVGGISLVVLTIALLISGRR